MAIDEQKDQESESTKPTDEKISDLSSKKLSRDEEEKVKGGAYHRPMMLE
jgi:hypothetical protein